MERVAYALDPIHHEQVQEVMFIVGTGAWEMVKDLDKKLKKRFALQKKRRGVPLWSSRIMSHVGVHKEKSGR